MVYNLDILHSHIHTSFSKKSRSTTFKMIESDNNELIIEYGSERAGFGPFFVGMMKETASVLYHSDISMTEIRHFQRDELDYYVYKIETLSNSQPITRKASSLLEPIPMHAYQNFILGQHDIQKFIPFYMCFNNYLDIIDMSIPMQRLWMVLY